MFYLVDGLTAERERPHRHTEGKPGKRCTTVNAAKEEPWPAAKPVTEFAIRDSAFEVWFSLPFTQDSMRELWKTAR
jgi:hypothetical protein